MNGNLGAGQDDSSDSNYLGSQAPLTLLAKGMIAVPAFLIATIIFISGNPLFMSVIFIISLLPLAIAVFIILKLSDTRLPKSFLVEQVFFGGVVAFIAALVELILAVSFFLPIFSKELRSLQPKYEQFISSSTPDTQQFRVDLVKIFVNAPTWKFLLISFLSAFIVAATVEETAKLLLAQRTKRLLPGGSRDCNLSPYSMVGGIMAGALGLAATEHVVASFQVAWSTAAMNGSYSFPFSAALFSLFRAVVAFPLHTGTALLIGVAMAKKLVLREQTSVIWPFLLAIAFHGTFDFVGIIAMSFVGIGAWPRWISFTIPFVDVVIVVILMQVCRRAYKSLDNNGYLEVLEDAV